MTKLSKNTTQIMVRNQFSCDDIIMKVFNFSWTLQENELERLAWLWKLSRADLLRLWNISD